MLFNNILIDLDIIHEHGIKEFLKTYWFVIGVLFGAILYLIEQKFKK